MGDFAVSRKPGEVLVSIGLGSCIGVALFDAERFVVGLAHVMLPQAGPGADESPGKYANLAVPVLCEELVQRGAAQRRLEAALVGGAQMFSFAGASPGRLDIGARNEQATREALQVAGIPVRAAATGGKTGRTIRVEVDGPAVSVKEAGGAPAALVGSIGG